MYVFVLYLCRKHAYTLTRYVYIFEFKEKILLLNNRKTGNTKTFLSENPKQRITGRNKDCAKVI